jgi:hypothetical protein
MTMHPWVRLTFFGIGILVLALAFQVKLVTVALGETFSTARITDSPAIAILAGLLLGIAERAVPREASRWATDFLVRSGPQQPDSGGPIS